MKTKNKAIKINLAGSSGFCFGVKRALDIACRTAKSQKNVYMLGDIVHNEDVVRQIAGCGIKKANLLLKGKNKTLLIRAHGASLKTFKQAKNSGYQIVDATCPMVKEIHRLAQHMEQKGYKIIIIGDKKHDEVQGIIGQIKTKALVIESPKDIPLKTVQKLNRAAILVQSTQNMDRALKIVHILRLKIKDLRFFNTICRPTRAKQKEIKEMPLKNEVMVIIGSRTSANTKRLYEISRALNEDTFWVQSKKELKARWFKNVETAGVIAGASTPDETTKAVIKQIRSYS